MQQQRASRSTYLLPQSLPTTNDAAKYHSYRVYHQVQTWLGNILDPTEWGLVLSFVYVIDAFNSLFQICQSPNTSLYQSEMMLNNVKTFQYNLYLNVQSHVVTLWKKQWEVLASFLSFLQWLLHHKMAKYHLRLSWYIHQSQMICVQLPFKGDVQLKITAVLSYSMKRNIFIRNFG